MEKGFLTLEDKPIEFGRKEPYNIVLFDVGGRIVTRVGTDTPFLKKNNFFALLPEEERSFFDEWSLVFGQKKLLLESTRGPVLVFSGIFHETGLFAAVLFHTPRETLRGFWKSGYWHDVKVSPFLMEKTLPQKGGKEECRQGTLVPEALAYGMELARGPEHHTKERHGPYHAMRHDGHRIHAG